MKAIKATLWITGILTGLLVIIQFGFVSPKKTQHEPIICRIIDITGSTVTLDFHNQSQIMKMNKDSFYVIIPLREYRTLKIKAK